MQGPDTRDVSQGPPALPPMATRATEEHSGLHDIKQLAANQKERISRRVTTETDVEESLLASTSGLSAVALPRPGYDSPRFADSSDHRVRPPQPSNPVDDSRSPLPVWIYAGIGIVAVGAIVLFMTRQPAQLAMNGPQAGASAAARPVQPSGAAAALPIERADDDQANSAPSRPETDDEPGLSVFAAPDEAGETASVGTQSAPAKPDPSVEIGGDDATREPVAGEEKASETRAGKRVAANKRNRAPVTKSSKKSASTSAKSEKTATRSPVAASKPAKTRARGKKSGKSDLDDLLDQAAGGSFGQVEKQRKQKKAIQYDQEQLSAGDIRAGMRGVMGKVQGCYDKYRVHGTVKIKVVIGQDGKISESVATGSFKDTPTGNCVAKVVRRARFPSFSSKPKSLYYPFLLSP